MIPKRLRGAVASVTAWLLMGGFYTAAAQARPNTEAASDVRAVMIVKSPRHLARAIAEQVEVPVAQAFEVVPQTTYKAHVKRMRLHNPLSVRTALRLARPLNLTHIIGVQVVGGRRNEPRLFLEVVVARMRPSSSVRAQRFFLPNGKLDAATAATVIERIKSLVIAPPPPPAFSRAHPSASAPSSQNDAQGEEGEDGAVEEEIEEGEDGEPRKKTSRVHLSASLAVTRRSASLETAAPNDSPPCFCGGGVLSNTFFGLNLLGDGFWEADGTGIGFLADGTVYLARTPVVTDTQKRDISSWVTHLRLAAAYRKRARNGLGVAPRVGYAYLHFPLEDGAFPGLAYSYPFLGAEVDYQFGPRPTRVFAAADWLFAIVTHDDAPRLGQSQGGMGLALAAGVEAPVAAFTLGARLRYQGISQNFSGQTFLFTPERFNNVTLSESAWQLLLSLGGRWL